MRVVAIDDKASGDRIAMYQIQFEGASRDQDYFDHAWNMAVKDGCVESGTRQHFDVTFADMEDAQ